MNPWTAPAHLAPAAPPAPAAPVADVKPFGGFAPRAGQLSEHSLTHGDVLALAGFEDRRLPASSSPAAATSAGVGHAGIAAGDGDLLPARFDGDRRIDADDWIQDIVDYVAIRRVSPADAVFLLRTRPSGAARTWLETVPAGTSFDETVARFRRRFGESDPCRPELMSEFFERRQGPDESAGRYIEDKARLARRMRINNEAFVLQGIIQGLRADVRRDVMLLQPASLEELTTAATRNEASARAVAAQDRSDNASILAQIAELRVRMNATQPPSGTQRPPSTGHAVVAPPTPYTHPDRD